MTPASMVGLIGLVMFSILFTFCLVRIHRFLSTEDYISKIYEKIKLRFHIVLGINAFLECISALSQLLNDGYTSWGYIAHLLALYANLVSFVNVIFMWNHVLASQNLIQVKWKYYVAFLSINLISTLAEVSIFAYYGDVDSEDYTTLQKVTGFVANILYVLSLFVTTIMILVVAERMKRKLNIHCSSSSSSGGTTAASVRSTRQLLRKINLCLLVCLLSYSLRIYFIGRLTLTWILTGEEPGFRQFSTLLWMLLTFWIPTLTPGSLFLYVMQPQSTTDIEKDGDGDKCSMTASLSTAPLSDQYYNYDLEDNITSNSEMFGNQDQSEGNGMDEVSSGPAREVSVSESDDDGFSERVTFYSKDGNDFKMSIFD